MVRINGEVDNTKDLINVIETATYEYGKCMKRTLQEALDYIREIRELLPLEGYWPTDAVRERAVREKLDNLADLLIRTLEK